MAYPQQQLYQEMAFIASHFHWSHAELMNLEHVERRRWCAEISSVNRQLNQDANATNNNGVRALESLM